MSILNVTIEAICEKITLNVKNMRLSKCIKHFDSKYVKIDAISANFILTLFVKIKFLFEIRMNIVKYFPSFITYHFHI